MLIGTVLIVCGAGSMQLSGAHPSVCPVQPQVCCCGPGSQQISSDCCTGGWLAVSNSHIAACCIAANAESATLSADVGS